MVIILVGGFMVAGTTLIINVLFLSGPLVGSLIWPVIAGLFWDGLNRKLVLGIGLGSLCGLISYFTIGWFVASLVGTAVSMIFTLLSRKFRPMPFPPTYQPVSST